MIQLWQQSCTFGDTAQLFGNNLSEWPARVYDAFEVFKFEGIRIENARLTNQQPEDTGGE